MIPAVSHGSSASSLNLNSTEIFVVGVALFIAFVTLYVVHKFRNSVLTEFHSAKDTIRDENQSLLKKVGSSLSPRIVHCAMEVDVAREAVAMMKQSIEMHRNNQLAFLEATRSGTTSNYDDHSDEQQVVQAFITFYGAADLGTPITRGLTKEQAKHFQDFNDVLAQAVELGVRVRRHINLFSKDDLANRTDEAKRGYLRWLVTRYEFIVSHPAFELIDNPRVPQWGASFSNLLTSEAVLEIKANGLSGIAIYHANISRNIRESLRRARDMAKADRITRVRSTDEASVEAFVEHILTTAADCDIDIKEKDKQGRFVFFESGSAFAKRIMDGDGQ